MDTIENKDYRCTNYNIKDFSLGTKKDDFMELLKKRHPRTTNIYNCVKEKSGDMNDEFRELYHKSCVYCGVDNRIISKSDFEVDHFIPSTSEVFKGDKNSIENIVSSCKYCNRKKSNMEFSDESSALLHPDNNKLLELFYRNDKYYIKVSSKYVGNKEIINFYQQLMLNSEQRRLDYFLMELKDFISLQTNDPLVSSIKDIITKCEQYRRDKY